MSISLFYIGSVKEFYIHGFSFPVVLCPVFFSLEVLCLVGSASSCFTVCGFVSVIFSEVLCLIVSSGHNLCSGCVFRCLTLLLLYSVALCPGVLLLVISNVSCKIL